MQGQRTACRYSDSSQYDNVPTRMRGSTSSPGILKRQRDVSFADPRRSRDYRLSGRDEIEILEECFDVLRTSTTTTSTQGTQTTGANGGLARATSAASQLPVQTHQSAGVPATPNDPGFVRHMSSNWTQMLKNKASETHRWRGSSTTAAPVYCLNLLLHVSIDDFDFFTKLMLLLPFRDSVFIIIGIKKYL